jgi:DNA-binding transcriptional MerR regulator
MYSIGAMAERTGVKVPTIRYYEQMGLLPEPCRTEGNQRRYSRVGVARLSFVKHARDLGFSIEAIRDLIALQDRPTEPCARANEIVLAQLADVRARIGRLKRLEQELQRISTHCEGVGQAGECHVLSALSDHDQCETAH